MSDELRKRLIADLLDYLDPESKQLLNTQYVTIGSVKVVLDDKATGQALAELRKAKGIKTHQLAAKMKISDVMLRKLESGARSWNLEKINQYTKLIEKLSQ